MTNRTEAVVSDKRQKFLFVIVSFHKNYSSVKTSAALQIQEHLMKFQELKCENVCDNFLDAIISKILKGSLKYKYERSLLTSDK